MPQTTLFAPLSATAWTTRLGRVHVRLLALLLVLPPTLARAQQDPGRNSKARAQPPRALPSKAWWQAIDDPELQACITRALQANPDLTQAAIRIEQAKTTAREMLRPLLPRLDGEVSINAGPLRSLGFQFGRRPGAQGGAAPVDLPLLYAMGSAHLRASLQVDLAGRSGLARKRARMDIPTQDLAAQDQRQTLVLNVLSAYLDAAAARAQLTTLNQQVKTLKALIETTARRLELGDRSAVDVLNQKQQLARVKAQIPLAQLQLEAFLTQLSRLQGEAPGRRYNPSAKLHAKLDPQPWLALSKFPDSDPLAQRSVAVAKRQLKQARIGEKRAQRAWVPSLQVGADAGVQGRYIGEFFSQGFWRMNALLSVPLYRGGEVMTEREKARLQTAQAQAKLDQVSLDAQKRWADLKNQVRLRAVNVQALRDQHQAAQLAANETKQRYLSGSSNYLEVLSALNALIGVELSLVTARRDLIASALSLRSFAANTVSSPGTP